MNKNRINLTVSDKLNGDMCKIRDKTGMTKSEIIRRGVSLLAIASAEEEQNNFIAVADSSGRIVKQLVIDI